MKYQGSCHCGRVAFEVEGELTGAMACNCSICSRKGSLLWFVPRDSLRLETPEDAAATYRFNKHVIAHRFCPSCGVQPLANGKGSDGKPVAMINLRCVADLDLDSLKINKYDGASH